MTQLKFKKQAPNTEGYMGNGIFIDEALVLSIEDFSQGRAEWQKYDFDLNLKINCILKKNDWERSFFVSGNFKKDEQTSEILDWGGCFKVMNFLANLEITDDDTELGKDNKVPAALLKAAEGRRFLILGYPNNNGKSSTWDQIESIKTEPEVFLKYFIAQWEKSGYPKNYAPKNAFTTPDKNPQNGNIKSSAI